MKTHTKKKKEKRSKSGRKLNIKGYFNNETFVLVVDDLYFIKHNVEFLSIMLTHQSEISHHMFTMVNKGEISYHNFHYGKQR